jgi:hypothetical protein
VLPAFSIEEVSKVIARLVPRLPGDATGFVTHHVIVSGLLADPEGTVIVAQARLAKPTSWSGDQAAAANMIAWFSQQITAGVSRWGEFFDREKRGNVWAYRAKITAPQPIALDLEALAAIEGDPRWFFHLRRERDRGIAEAKRNAAKQPDGSLVCEGCGFVSRSTYPGLEADLCEIHHRLPLAAGAAPVETSLNDLAVLCPNCHRAIHRTQPLMSVEEFRAEFFARAALSA